MRRFLLISIFLTLTFTYGKASAPAKTPQERYIEQYAPLAVEEMYRTGVPASITLAQGMLESRYGLSELAVKGNNHFGIKCHNSWSGKKMYYDDDRRGECFRKYSSPEQSYRDHSDFLRYRGRYSFLFDYRVTDYKSWAHGLRKAGYATDRSYAKKLISLIEEYDLNEYDRKPASFARTGRSSKAKVDSRMTREEKKEAKKAAKEAREAMESITDEIPMSPSQIARTKALTDVQRSDFHFSMSREMYSQNGVPFVYSMEGETYASIADANNLFLREILKYNDLSSEVSLTPGTLVYLQPKKKQADKGLDKHVVEQGETMRGISQMYGVRLSSLYKLNGMSSTAVLREGDIIRLRKK